MPARDDDHDSENVSGDVPEGVGPEIFRERLDRLRQEGAEHGAQIRLQDEHVYVEDIESIETEPGGGHSRVRLRNGLIIGGLTGAAIVAAIATVRYRRRRKQQ
jgi:hypothetical protein